MTNKEDEIRLQNHRCRFCGARVKSVWNLKTTQQVVCVERCKEGRYAMDVHECVIIDDTVDADIEFLEDVEGLEEG